MRRNWLCGHWLRGSAAIVGVLKQAEDHWAVCALRCASGAKQAGRASSTQACAASIRGASPSPCAAARFCPSSSMLALMSHTMTNPCSHIGGVGAAQQLPVMSIQSNQIKCRSSRLEEAQFHEALQCAAAEAACRSSPSHSHPAPDTTRLPCSKAASPSATVATQPRRALRHPQHNLPLRNAPALAPAKPHEKNMQSSAAARAHDQQLAPHRLCWLLLLLHAG
jgi:hypothetical protein